MNYIKTYEDLINNAKKECRQRGTGIYFENHHIIPRCMNGTDDNTNLILLTAREHFVAHWLLVKIYPDNFKLIYALNSFALTNSGRRSGCSHLYKYARELYIQALKHDDVWKRKMAKSLSELIWVKNEKTGDCLRIHKNSLDSFLSLGYTNGRFIKHRISPSKETREKISKSHKGKTCTTEQKQVLSQNGKNKVWICNGIENKHIQKEELEIYLNCGWNRGRLKNANSFGKTRNRVQLTKDGCYKYAKPEDVDDLLFAGWVRGSPLIGHHQTDFQRNIVKERTSGTIWINNGLIQKRIKKEQQNNFPVDVWKIGRLKKNDPT